MTKHSKKCNGSLHRTGSKTNIPVKNRPISCSNNSFSNRRKNSKQRKFVNAFDDSSFSEDSEISPTETNLRILSNYESFDSPGTSENSSFPNLKQKKLNKSSSSEDSEVSEIENTPKALSDYGSGNSPSSSSNSSFLTSKRRKLARANNEPPFNGNVKMSPLENNLRALSEYKSGDISVKKAGSSLAHSSRVNSEELTSTEHVSHTTPEFEDSSSSDSDELFTRLTSKRGSVRTLSDYETGDSNDRAAGSFLNSSRSSQNVNNPSSSSRQNDDLNLLSSDNDSSYKITRNMSKKPHKLFSTSDSSDDDTPVRHQHFRKRKRINSSSEENENVNVILSLKRKMSNQNDLPTSNRGSKYRHTRPQTTRQLRPRINKQMSYRETDSDSSSEDVFERIMTNEYSTGNNNHENLMEGSRSNGGSDDLLNRRVCSPAYERSAESQQNTRSPATGRQVIRRSRRQIVGRSRQLRNNEFETLRISSPERDSETSSDDNSYSSRLIRVKRFGGARQPRRRLLDSSDSEPFVPRRLRVGTVQIHYSDSDSSGEQTLPDNFNNSGTGNLVVSTKPLVPFIIQNDNSSNSDAESEICPICFSSFDSKEVATPDSCDHFFCTICIQEWAKSNNTCPIDRKIFNKIMIRSTFKSEVIREIPVVAPSMEATFSTDDEEFFFSLLNLPTSSGEEEEQQQDEDEEEDERCCICYLNSNSHNLILCDYCNNVYHMSCLTPPLRSLPVCDWFCPECVEFEMVENLI